jgi:hypothetical protein
MRYLVSIVCLSVLCLVCVLPHVQFLGESYQISRNLDAQLNGPRSQHHTVRIHFQHGEQPTWITAGKEFKHKGYRYDVVRKKHMSDGVAYFCIRDVQETELYNRTSSLLKQDVSGSNGASKISQIAFVTANYVEIDVMYFPFNHFIQETNEMNIPYRFSVQHFFGEPNSPPPMV